MSAALFACSSSDDGASPRTPPTVTDSGSVQTESDVRPSVVTTTSVPADVGAPLTTLTSDPAVTSSPATGAAPVLWPSLGRFAEFFSASSEVIAADTGGTSYWLTLDDVVMGDAEGFGDGFVAPSLFDAGIMLGTMNESGEVTATMLLFDPDGASAADVLTAFLTSLLGSGTSFDLDPVLADYSGLVARSRDGAGEQLWFGNDGGTNHSLVVSVVEGAVPGDNLIEVAVVPIRDEESAKAGVALVRPVLLNLVPDPT